YLYAACGLFALMFSCLTKGSAQDLPSRKFLKKPEISYTSKYTKGFYIGYGYIQSNLLNSNYGLNRKNNIIKPGWGNCFQAKYIYNPIIIDFNWFSANYKVDENTSNSLGLTDSIGYKHRGFD